ncbi:hypothetical protein [Bacillus sp. SM2101]|uniref:hypothetical protein n=1 Tax=Bacillus sp. SM2101 TaxID=2805366 RepID=UPI001BDF3946|nr:hypothetical protein [Bacillus sp. SM2101]
MLNLDKFEHQSLLVSNLEKSIRWYNKRLGYKLVLYNPEHNAILSIDEHKKNFLKLDVVSENTKFKGSKVLLKYHSLDSIYKMLNKQDESIHLNGNKEVGGSISISDRDSNELLFVEK